MNKNQKEFIKELCALLDEYGVESMFAANMEGNRIYSDCIAFSSNGNNLYVSGIIRRPQTATNKIYPERYEIQSVSATTKQEDFTISIQELHPDYNAIDNGGDK